MLVARFLDGLAGSAFLSVAGGTVGDTFPKEKLSMPMMIYSAAPFCGPLLGPVVGNFIASYMSWRWCFWVLMMWAGVNWLMLFFFVPETYSPVLLRRKARQLRRDTGDDRWKAPIEMMNKSVTKTVMWSCIRPFQLLALEVGR
jgi:MFS family permease